MATYTAGIDVSRYEGEIDWKQVAAAGYRFAVIRATVGDYYTDPRFYTYWTDAKAAGLLVSAYHVVVSTKYAENQISRLFSVMGDRKADFPLILDVERDDQVSNAANTACIQDCIREMAKYDARRPIIYTAYYYWKDHVLTSSDWANYDLWVATYSEKPYIPPGWSTWKFWQYSENGKVPGISSGTDLNWFNGSYEDLVNYSGQSVTEPTPVNTSGLSARVLVSVLNIRSGAGISYKNIGTLLKNATVNIINLGGTDVWIKSEAGTWSACYHAGSQYMEVLSVENSGDTLKARVLVDQLNVRNGPSTSNASVVGKLKKDDVVTITGIGGQNVWVQFDLGQWAAFYYGNVKYMELT